MRILQLVTQTKVGGAESFALGLSLALGRRGHTVRLLANRDNGPLFAACPPHLDHAACRRSSRLDLRVFSFLLGHLRGFRPDVIHAHNFPANVWARALAPLFPRVRVVCHEHSGRIGERGAGRFLIDRALNGATSRVIAVSDEIVAVLRERRVIAPGKIVRVPVGIDTARFAAGNADESILPQGARGRRRILHVASLIPVKNHALLLDAFSDLPEDLDLTLLLAGDGPLRSEIEERIARPPLAGRVFLLGHRSDVPDLLRLSSAFVLPSHAEGLPLSVLEAMAAGVPPIASRVGAIPGVVEDGRAGILVAPGDRASLASAMARVARDPDGAAEMGRYGREEVRERYSIDAVAAAIEEIYGQVTSTAG